MTYEIIKSVIKNEKDIWSMGRSTLVLLYKNKWDI